MSIDFASLFRTDLPPPAERWDGFPTYNLVGGHNDADSVPVDALADAAARVLRREGSTLATYGLNSGAQGHRGLREFVAAELEKRAGMDCDADQILMTSGSLQALDLVNSLLLERGDTVIVEEATYGGALSRFERCGANVVGIDVDEGGMRMDVLADTLDELGRDGALPKFIYTIPTVQNPTGTVMGEGRRRELLRLSGEHGVPIFEDDCYADLVWSGRRPPAIRALDDSGSVIYCGSFSKSVAPALRVGYVVADWPVLSRMLALKTDGGTGAIEQMILAEFAPAHFDTHVAELTATLRGKCDVMADALRENFGSTARFRIPDGGIFIWVTLPPGVDTSLLAEAARSEGIDFNPGAEWCTDPDTRRNRLRLCFAHPSHDEIRVGVARLAAIYHDQTGFPGREPGAAAPDPDTETVDTTP